MMVDYTNRTMELEEAIEEYKNFVDTGNYSNSVNTMFSLVGPFLAERGVRTVDDIRVHHCRELAKELKRCTKDGELNVSSARTYYSTFRAWLKFAVQDRIIDQNPAVANRAESPLPEPTNDTEQQFWSPSDREEILIAADDEAANSQDELDESKWAPTFRDRGVTYTFSYSGSRITEILASTNDEKRTGIQWSDVDLEEGTVRVFSKSREYEYMGLPSPAAAVLSEYKQILSPANEQWPVFPTGSLPYLYEAAREQLADRGLNEAEREELLSPDCIHDVYRSQELIPPSMTGSGFRNGFWQDLIDDYDLLVDGEQPEIHAARRGLGDELYREKPRVAQSALRHVDISTTHKSYSHIQAAETANEIEAEVEAADPREFLDDEEGGTGEGD